MAIISEITLSMINGRFDSEYYQPKYLESAKKLSNFETKKLVSIANVNGGKRLPLGHSLTIDGIPYVRVVDINNGFIHRNQIAYIDETTWRYIKSYDIREDDVLVTIVGNTVGLTGILKENLGTANFTENCARIRNCKLGANYVLAYLLSKYGQNQVEREKVGTAQPKLSLDRLRRFVIPIFESKELGKINFYISSSSICHNDSNRLYEEAQQLLESELSLDKLSFQKPVGYTAKFSELELSRRLDAQHYQAQFTKLLNHLAKFPSRKVREIRTCNRRGIQPIYVSDGAYDVINSQYLGSKHINYDGLQKTSPQAFAASPVAHIRQNDLLIYTAGAYIGRTNVYLSDAPAFASNHVNILRITPDIDAAYMATVFQSVVGQFQTQKHSRGSAQAELYPNDIDKFVVPILSVKQQRIIGDLVRESLVKQRESESLLEQAKARVEQLIEEAVQS